MSRRIAVERYGILGALGLQSAIITIILWMGIAARCAALWRCVFSRLLRAHPFFTAMTLVTLGRGIAAVTLARAPYRVVFDALLWPVAILNAAAILEAFWRAASHFRKMRGFGWGVVATIAAISALAALAVGVVRANYHGDLGAELLFNLYTEVAFLFVALLFIGFFRQFRAVPIRPNAIRHLQVLSVLFGSYFLGTLIGQVSQGTWRFLTNFVVTLGAAVAYSWWAVSMTPEGEKLPFDPPPLMSREQFDSAEAAHRRDDDSLRRAGGEAIRKALGK